MGKNYIFCRKCGTKAGVHTLSATGAEPSEDSTMFCAYCGNEMRVGARFCDECGAEGGKLKKVNCAQEGGDRERHEERDSMLKVATLLAFFLMFGCFGFVSYRYFSGDTPPRVSGPSGGGASAIQTAEPEDSEAPHAPAPAENTPSGNDPIVMAGPIPYADSETQSAQTSPDEQNPAAEEGAPTADGRAYAWSTPDSDGYSDLDVRDRSGVAVLSASLPVEVTADNVRMRSAPNTESEILRRLAKGTALGASQRYSSGRDRFHWFKVGADGEAGWVYGGYLKITQSVAEPSGPRASAIRTAPGSEGAAPLAESANVAENPAVTASQDNRKRAAQLVKEGRALWTQKDWAGAHERFSEAYRLDPDDEVKVYADNAKLNMDIERLERQSRNPARLD
jgi:uncharacterized protein YgiM (DUF1202 family)